MFLPAHLHFVIAICLLLSEITWLSLGTYLCSEKAVQELVVLTQDPLTLLSDHQCNQEELNVCKSLPKACATGLFLGAHEGTW